MSVLSLLSMSHLYHKTFWVHCLDLITVKPDFYQLFGKKVHCCLVVHYLEVPPYALNELVKKNVTNAKFFNT